MNRARCLCWLKQMDDTDPELGTAAASKALAPLAFVNFEHSRTVLFPTDYDPTLLDDRKVQCRCRSLG